MKNEKIKLNFDFDKLADSFRKEIAEFGSLLNLIYEQQNCLIEHNPVSLLQATSKIEAQLPANQLATADRTALMQQLADDLNLEEIPLNELPKRVPIELQSLFKALVDEIISLRFRIKSKTQIQQKLLGQAQMINSSVIEHVIPNSKLYNKHGKPLLSLSETASLL